MASLGYIVNSSQPGTLPQKIKHWKKMGEEENKREENRKEGRKKGK